MFALPHSTRYALGVAALLSAIVRGLAFSPDGEWLATGSEDKTVKLWRLERIAAGESSPAPIALSPAR